MGETRKKVEAELAAEARKFDKSNRGVHRFNPIWQTDDDPPFNWTTNFQLVASNLPMDDMRDALERVQAKFPKVDFPA